MPTAQIGYPVGVYIAVIASEVGLILIGNFLLSRERALGAMVFILGIFTFPVYAHVAVPW
jgi:hypothetical protein